MNWFACYLAISCCNKLSIFFVFIRELGQIVCCHKFGGPCNCCICYNENDELTQVHEDIRCLTVCV